MIPKPPPPGYAYDPSNIAIMANYCSDKTSLENTINTSFQKFLESEFTLE